MKLLASVLHQATLGQLCNMAAMSLLRSLVKKAGLWWARHRAVWHTWQSYANITIIPCRSCTASVHGPVGSVHQSTQVSLHAFNAEAQHACAQHWHMNVDIDTISTSTLQDIMTSHDITWRLEHNVTRSHDFGTNQHEWCPKQHAMLSHQKKQ